jgi:hypothetical protein
MCSLFSNAVGVSGQIPPTIKPDDVVRMMHALFKFQNIVLNCSLWPLNSFYMLLDLSYMIFKHVGCLVLVSNALCFNYMWMPEKIVYTRVV